MKLTDNQIKFLVDTFFTSERYPGLASIGEKLVTKGKCIVAGEEPIRCGGAMNFAKTTKAEDCVGCLEYTFDLGEFLKSKFYEETRERFLAIQEDKIKEAKEEFQKAEEMFADINSLI